MIILQINTLFFISTKILTALESCLEVNKQIPSFCYNQNSALEGNCRMCLIELDKVSKPQASCCFPIQNNLKFFTNTPLVKKARENIIEYSLVQHPLDCPICDQGGECDLQDNSINQGKISSRFFQKKRSLINKVYSSLIATKMNRCIYCTKCIRYTTKTLNYPLLGSFNRGLYTEIGMYNSINHENNFLGNLIDICPVGALTAKPYAFQTRSWDFKSNLSLDLFDSLGIPIRIDSVNSTIIRILPQNNKIFKDFLINDRIRFCLDLFNKNSLVTPQTFKSKKALSLAWNSTLQLIIFLLNQTQTTTKILIDSSLDLYTLYLLKLLQLKYNKKNFLNSIEAPILTFSNNYLFNIQKVLNESTLLILLGINPQLESSNLNLEFLKLYQTKKLNFLGFGFFSNLSYPINHLGTQQSKLLNLVFGTSFQCFNILNQQKINCIYNSNLFKRFDGITLYLIMLNLLIVNKHDLKNLNILQNTANKVGTLLLGFKSSNLNLQTEKITSNYLITFLNQEKQVNNVPLLIEQTTLTPIYNSFLRLPMLNYIETFGTYINTFGFTQKIYPIKTQSTPNQSIFNLISLYYNLTPKNSIPTSKLKILLQTPILESKYIKLGQCFVFNICISFLGPIGSNIENFYQHITATRQISYKIQSTKKSNFELFSL